MDTIRKDSRKPSSLGEYAIKHLGAVPIENEEIEGTRPPFPCLTGASNTSSRYKIDQKEYPRIVAAGVDTLQLNFGVAEYREKEVFKDLEDTKLLAVSAGRKGRKGMPVCLFGSEFMVQARGTRGGYEYLLNNGDLELQIMPDARGGKPSPEIRAILRSSYLWGLGEIQAYDKVVKLVNNLAVIVYGRVSRADLCVDRVMTLPKIDRKQQVVSRLREKDLYYGGDFTSGIRETGFEFGRAGMMVCRLYDKAYEISVKGQGHIMPLWKANGWDGVSPVCRFELELKRNGLRKFDPNMDFATFQAFKPDIWAFGTTKYIRIVRPGSASRKERSRVTKYWEDYQNSGPLFGTRLGVLPHTEVSLDWRHLIPQALGCLATAWAKLAADVGDVNAKFILEKEWGQELPQEVIEAGLLKRARFAHIC